MRSMSHMMDLNVYFEFLQVLLKKSFARIPGLQTVLSNRFGI